MLIYLKIPNLPEPKVILFWKIPKIEGSRGSSFYDSENIPQKIKLGPCIIVF
jgi:hypothetical protein